MQIQENFVLQIIDQGCTEKQHFVIKITSSKYKRQNRF